MAISTFEKSYLNDKRLMPGLLLTIKELGREWYSGYIRNCV